MPVYQAAQAVQHSADGSAYMQYEKMAAAMTPAFTGQRGHAVYCWSARRAGAPADVSRSPRARRHLRPGAREVTEQRDSRGSAAAGAAPSAGPGRGVTARLGGGTWLVTHASTYHIHQVRFSGYLWRAAASSKGWVRDAGAPPPAAW